MPEIHRYLEVTVMLQILSQSCTVSGLAFSSQELTSNRYNFHYKVLSTQTECKSNPENASATVIIVIIIIIKNVASG